MAGEQLLIRHLFAHFLAFQEDKFRYPEFFCWPGAWLAADKVSAQQVHLFEWHGALFVDKEHDDSVFPRLQDGRDVATVHATFSKFYNNAVVYDLTSQWICQDGPFRYPFTRYSCVQSEVSPISQVVQPSKSIAYPRCSGFSFHYQAAPGLLINVH